MSSLRAKVKHFVLLPLVVLAAGIFASFALRTTLQIDSLRQQSILEATHSLANEKASRVDRQIIDQDNVAMAIADPARLEQLTENWVPTAQRETPTIRAILILDDARTVVSFASRATGALAEEESFRRLLINRMIGDMQLGDQPNDELHHLHRDYGQQSYLVSYWQRVHHDRRYLIVAWHDIGRIVRDTLPALYADMANVISRDSTTPPTGTTNRVNVVDEKGGIIYGPTLRSGEFTVAVRFPTTLYNWRVQVSPLASEQFASRVRDRRLLEIAIVSISCIIIVAGAVAIVLVSEKERKISALKSDFVANVSHELKTPLALVRMFAEMLQTGRVASESKRVEYLDIIVRESERLSSLIENVLDFARLERGHGSYEFAEADVSDVLDRAISIHRYRADRMGIAIVVDIEPELPRVWLDERAIQLAIANLVDNALKYAPSSLTLRVSAKRHTSAFIRMSVADEGPGVAPEDHSRIFERFVRLASSRDLNGDEGASRAKSSTSPVRGTGIGLALVKHIAHSHGGRAWVESTPGRGACFSFTVGTRKPRG